MESTRELSPSGQTRWRVARLIAEEDDDNPESDSTWLRRWIAHEGNPSHLLHVPSSDTPQCAICRQRHPHAATVVYDRGTVVAIACMEVH